MRIDPPVSVPSATGQAPAPTRAADPPLEPPAVLPGSKGLRASGTCGWTAPAAYSSRDVAANTSAPAWRSAVTTLASSAAGAAPMSWGFPLPRGCPAMSIMSFTATGTPCSGPPGRRAGAGNRRDHRVQRLAKAQRPLVGGQQFEVGDLAGPLAPLDRADQFPRVAGQRAAQVAQQVVDLGLALADHQVAVDAAVRLGALPVEGDQAGQRALKVAGVEAVESLGPDRRLGEHLSRDRQHQRPPSRILQGVGDRQVGHRPGVQHRPVSLLAPQKAHDVAGGLRVGQRFRQFPHPVAAAAPGLPDAEGPDVALHDQPGLEPVRAEVDEADHDPFRADGRCQGARGQAVLKADNVTAGSETPLEQLCRRGGVVALHGHRRPWQRCGKIVWQHGPCPHREVLDRPADGEAPLVDRLDVRSVGVTEQDVVAVPDHVGADRAADRTGPDNRQLHLELLRLSLLGAYGQAGQAKTRPRHLGHVGAVAGGRALPALVLTTRGGSLYPNPRQQGILLSGAAIHI